MLKGEKNFDFSYSGLKTAVINYIHTAEQKGESVNRADVACSFQSAAIDVLVNKTIAAAKLKNVKTIAAGGGVVANGYLREKLKAECEKRNIKLYLPERGLCTDNAAMIGAEGYIRYLNGDFADMTLNAEAQVEL